MIRKLIMMVVMCSVPFLAHGGEPMNISSPDFKPDGIIPPKFSCQGADISPTLEITYIPADAQSLVLIVDDPDAPMGTWDHWIVYNINPATTFIKEDTVPGVQALNSAQRVEWGGPCPPSGTHRYFFKLFALDTKLDLGPRARKMDVEEAMQGHILEKAELVGLYKKF